jgi:hypothetical protein
MARREGGKVARTRRLESLRYGCAQFGFVWYYSMP